MLTQTDIDNAEASIKAVADWARGGPTYEARMPNGSLVPSPNKVIADSVLFKSPITWSTGLTVNDATQTYEESGVIYAPIPSNLPFTTGATFAAESSKYFVVQGITTAQLATQNLVFQKFEGATVSQLDANTFRLLSGDFTTRFAVGTRLKLDDSSTLYGTVTAVSYPSTFTEVDVLIDDGTSLTSNLSAVYTSIADVTNKPIPTSAVFHVGNWDNPSPTNIAQKLNSVISVKADMLASGNWLDDDGSKIQDAFAASQSVSNSWTNTAPGENPTSASKPPVFFDAGIYLTSVPLTNSIAYNFIHVFGYNAIVADSTLRTVSEAFRFGHDWSMEGIEIRGFERAIVIDNNNVNQGHHWITNCHFHKQSVATIEFDTNPQSGQMTIEKCSATTFDGSKFISMPTTSERVDFLAIRDVWLQPTLNTSNTFNDDGTCMTLRCGSCLIENLTGVPTGTLSSSTPASWMRFYGNNLQINHSNFGPELTGGVTTLESFAEATESTDLKRTISILNSRMGTSGSRPQIIFFKLPNTIRLQGLLDDGSNGGVQYVDAADAVGVSESSGIDIDNLKAFAKDGAVHIDSWDYLISRQDTMGLHAGLGYQLLQAAFYDNVGVPYKDKVKIEDILCVLFHNQGTKSTANTNTTGVDTTDYRGVRVRTRTATSDNASYDMSWSAFIDYTLIGASANGVMCAMTLLVELEYTPAKQGSASFNPSVAQNNKKYILENGSKTYAVPFVYFNTTNAADTDLDKLSINFQDLSNGDQIAIKRIVVLRGFQQTDIEQITAYQEVVTTPADIANTKFDSTAGWVIGDRVLNHAASTEVGYYICTTDQLGTTAWGSSANIV